VSALRITVVSVPVTDQDRAAAFYVDRLGFEVVVDAVFGEGMRWVQLRPPGGGASIALVTWFDRMPPGSLHGAVVEIDDVRAEYERLTRNGVQFGQEVEEAPWGAFTTFEDPDGNAWVLQQSR
jgi:catechol 2,3-dioxygenase-like lactoylglutathione lyase family enzyme